MHPVRPSAASYPAASRRPSLPVGLRRILGPGPRTQARRRTSAQQRTASLVLACAGAGRRCASARKRSLSHDPRPCGRAVGRSCGSSRLRLLDRFKGGRAWVARWGACARECRVTCDLRSARARDGDDDDDDGGGGGGGGGAWVWPAVCTYVYIACESMDRLRRNSKLEARSVKLGRASALLPGCSRLHEPGSAR